MVKLFNWVLYFWFVDLKKLALKGLDKMNRVTDLLFTRILSKMKLKQLVLTSDKPIEKVNELKYWRAG